MTLDEMREVNSSATARLGGIHAATICPFYGEDLAIDETTLAEHCSWVTGHYGIRGLLINGHAGENSTLNGAEKRRVIEVVREAVGQDVFITTGIYCESSDEAAEHARHAADAGADAILVFPPNAWALGQEPEAVVQHHQRIATATELPLLLYQAPVHAGRLAYPVDTIKRLMGLSSVIGIKEGSWEIATYEETRLAARAIRPDVAVLGSGDEHLLVSYLIGTEGSQVSLAAVVPEQVNDLWDHAAAGDWVAARAMHERLYPLAVAIYRERPGGRATARLKACLKILGLIKDDRVRAPGIALPKTEYDRLTMALGIALNA